MQLAFGYYENGQNAFKKITKMSVKEYDKNHHTYDSLINSSFELAYTYFMGVKPYMVHYKEAKKAAAAATAAAPATASETTRKRVWLSEHKMPTNASTPAKPSPQCSGTCAAKTMPPKLAICQPIQFKKQLPLR